MIGDALQHFEVFAALHTPAAGYDNPRRYQLRALRHREVLAGEAGDARILRRRHCFHTCAAAFGGGVVECGHAHGNQFDLVVGFYRRDGIAGVDGAYKGIGVLDLRDIGDGGYVQKCRGPRQEVFAEFVCGCQHVAVVTGETDDQRRQVFSQAVGIARIVGATHLADAHYLGGGVRRRGAVFTGDQYLHIVAELAGGGNGIESCRAEALVVVFRYDQYAHSDHLRFATELFHQLLNTFYPDARFALGRLDDLQDGHVWGDVDAQLFGRHGFHGLLLCFHDVWQ